MKKTILIRIISLCFLGLFLTNCSNDDSTDSITFEQTSLKIIVKDSNGDPVSSAIVRVFLSNEDAINQVNQVLTTITTDTSGEATFTSLIPNNYFFRVDKGCQNNLYSITGIKNLAVNSLNTISTVLGSTGRLSFINTSSYPYDIYVNDVIKITDMPGETNDFGIFPTGSYTIKVVQKSGYLLYPTIKTYTRNLLCGGNSITTFP